MRPGEQGLRHWPRATLPAGAGDSGDSLSQPALLLEERPSDPRKMQKMLKMLITPKPSLGPQHVQTHPIVHWEHLFRSYSFLFVLYVLCPAQASTGKCEDMLRGGIWDSGPGLGTRRCGVVGGGALLPAVR